MMLLTKEQEDKMNDYIRVTFPNAIGGFYQELRTLYLKGMEDANTNPFSDVKPNIVQTVTVVKPTKTCMNHQWTNYVGLTAAYEYCIVCDERR